MSCNRIRIKCDADKISCYYFEENKQEWKYIDYYESSLSGTNSNFVNIKKNAEEIIETIDNDYNYEDEGVKILFAGSKDDYEYLCKVITEKFTDSNIICYYEEPSNTEVAFIDPDGSNAIDMITELIGENKFTIESSENYIAYIDAIDDIKYYILDEKTTGKLNKDFLSTLEELIKFTHIKTVFYCIASEQFNSELVGKLMEKPMTIVVVQTNPDSSQRRKIRKKIIEGYGNIKIVSFPKRIKYEMEKDNEGSMSEADRKSSSFFDNNNDEIVRAIRLSRLAKYIYKDSVNVILLGGNSNDRRDLIESIYGYKIPAQIETERASAFSKSLSSSLDEQSASYEEGKDDKVRVTIYNTSENYWHLEEIKNVLAMVQEFYYHPNDKNRDNVKNIIFLFDNSYDKKIDEELMETLQELMINYEIPVTIITYGANSIFHDIFSDIFTPTFNLTIPTIDIKGDMGRTIIDQDIKAENLIDVIINHYSEICRMFSESASLILQQKKENESIREELIKEKIEECKECVSKYVEGNKNSMFSHDFILNTSLPNISRRKECVPMIEELNKIAGIKVTSDFSDSGALWEALNGKCNSPIHKLSTMMLATTMAVSGPIYHHYDTEMRFSVIGETYIKVLEIVLRESTKNELEDENLMQTRILNGFSKL